MTMKVLVTGADGLLGSNLVRELLHRSYEVNVLILPGSEAVSLRGLPIEIYQGNILRPADIIPAIRGCRAVIHVAASTSVWPSRSAAVRKVNVQGVRNMVDAAMGENIERFVHIGSASSFGFGTKNAPGDETTPYAGHKYGLDYIDSKYEGQQLVLKYVRENNFPALVINPTFMFGAYDHQPGSGKMILAVYRGQMPVVAGGGKNFVYVKDVAVAAANALTMGRVGECYVAGGVNLSYGEISGLIAAELGVSAPRLKAPDLLLKSFGFLSKWTGKVLKREPKISYAMARVACHGHYFSAQKAIEELAMPQTDIRIAIREAYDWFRESGYC
jgi:dihydroflavonol-4-reductase